MSKKSTTRNLVALVGEAKIKEILQSRLFTGPITATFWTRSPYKYQYQEVHIASPHESERWKQSINKSLKFLGFLRNINVLMFPMKTTSSQTSSKTNKSRADWSFCDHIECRVKQLSQSVSHDNDSRWNDGSEKFFWNTSGANPWRIDPKVKTLPSGSRWEWICIH